MAAARLLIDDAETVEKMNAKYGKLYTASTIKAGSYPGQDKDNAIAVPFHPGALKYFKEKGVGG